MHKALPLVVGGMIALVACVAWASHTGLGVPQPEKEPMSIREESARGSTWGRGHHRTHFFMLGGGIHGGK